MLALALLLAAAPTQTSSAADTMPAMPRTSTPAAPPKPPASPPRAPLGRPPSRPPEPPAPPRPPAPPARAAEDEPVVRAQAGDMGLVFRFGGLGTLGVFGDTQPTDVTNQSLSNQLVTQVAVKWVDSEAWMYLVYFGTGLRRFSGNGDSDMDLGANAGAGLEYHFRIWRRISPFVGASVGFGVFDPEGSDNARIRGEVEGQLGVEYYVADRLSLQAVYLLGVAFEDFSGEVSALTVATQAGGSLNLTFYF